MCLCNNHDMNSREKIRLYFALEVIIWLLVIFLVVGAVRFLSIKKQSELKTYQIFMQDIDGLIEGSPVRMMGVPIGYIKTINIVQDHVYVKFVVTNKSVILPKGVIATVEFNGMAGSKSLELYPPDEVSKAEGNLISIKRTNRLGNALGLLDDMFAKLGAIFVRCEAFSEFITEALPKSESVSKDPVGDAAKSINIINVFINNLDKRRIDFKKLIKPQSDPQINEKEVVPDEQE